MKKLFIGESYWHPSVNMKVLIVLIERNKPVDRKTLKEDAKIDTTTLESSIQELKKYKIVKTFRKGNSKMTVINKKSQVAKGLFRINRELMKYQVVEDL